MIFIEEGVDDMKKEIEKAEKEIEEKSEEKVKKEMKEEAKTSDEKKTETKEKTEEKKPEKSEKRVVLPGDEIIKSMDYLPGRNCFRDGDSIYAKRLGVLYYKGRVIEVIPLSGAYMPESGDMVVGTVEEVQHSGWNIDINSPYKAYLSLAGVRGFIDASKTDLSKIYGIGDILYAMISEVTPTKDVRISMKDPKTRKFQNGRIVKISPVKVPRVIGKQGSMINMIKEKTGCRISVGQNGVIWLQGDKENLAARAIMEIEENSQITGLTDHIAKLLGDDKGGS